MTASAEAWRNRGQAVESVGYIAVLDDWRPGAPAEGRVVATDLGEANELRFSADEQCGSAVPCVPGLRSRLPPRWTPASGGGAHR